ncbi:MAG TPA: hypothetical protein VN426_00485 [Syntrophomonadaceae bacterium]|nr:hypothetical protein [Syntrophomonadaceae bacterium]
MLDFAHNLYYETINKTYMQTLSPQLYIKSPGDTAQQLNKMIAYFNKNGIGMIADNCYFPMINKIADRLKTQKDQIISDIKKEEQLKKRKLTYSDLSDHTRTKVDQLLEHILKEVPSYLDNDVVLLKKQLEFGPERLIGPEDITIPLLMEMNIDQEYTGYSADKVNQANHLVVQRTLALNRQLNDTLREACYPVAGATDYDTALEAGRSFGGAGIKAVALALGAFMSETSFTDSITINGHSYKLPESLPKNILQCALLTKGFLVGYAQSAGTVPSRMHLLGLGSLMMITTLMAALTGIKQMTFDATSPIYDANQGVFYVNQPALLKLKSEKIAQWLATQAGAQWECNCPFCTKFTQRYPFDYAKGQKIFKDAGLAEITKEQLMGHGLLSECYFLLGGSEVSSVRRDIVAARVGHNHWMIKEMVNEINAITEPTDIVKYIKQTIDDYTTHSASKKQASAYQLAYKIMCAENVVTSMLP